MLLGILIGIVGTVIVILLYGAFSKPATNGRIYEYWEKSLEMQRHNSDTWNCILFEIEKFNARAETS